MRITKMWNRLNFISNNKDDISSSNGDISNRCSIRITSTNNRISKRTEDYHSVGVEDKRKRRESRFSKVTIQRIRIPS